MKVKFGVKLFQTKLLSRLSHKVCRLLSSPVLLRKFTIFSLRRKKLHIIVCHRVVCFDDGARRCEQEKKRDVTPHSPIWTRETCWLVIMLKSQYKNTTGTKINQSDDSNTRSWSAACRLRARRVPNCICLACVAGVGKRREREFWEKEF